MRLHMLLSRSQMDMHTATIYLLVPFFWRFQVFVKSKHSNFRTTISVNGQILSWINVFAIWCTRISFPIKSDKPKGTSAPYSM